MKEILQITITTKKRAKTKIGRWFQQKWFVIWGIWRTKLLAKFFGGLYWVFYHLTPKSKRDEIFGTDIEYEIIINEEK